MNTFPKKAKPATDKSINQSGVSVDGYTRITKKPAHPGDESYSQEAIEEFYEEVTIDGETGMLYRNNVLDRNT